MESVKTHKRGRPKTLPHGCWRHSDVLARRIGMIMRDRDNTNEFAATKTRHRLLALANRLIRPSHLTRRKREQLLAMTRDKKPSEIARVLQCWRFHLTDRSVRRLQKNDDIQYIRWA